MQSDLFLQVNSALRRASNSVGVPNQLRHVAPPTPLVRGKNLTTPRLRLGCCAEQTQNIIDIFENLNGICKNINGICRNINDILTFSCDVGEFVLHYIRVHTKDVLCLYHGLYSCHS